MSPAKAANSQIFNHDHLLGIEGLKEAEITQILDLADIYVEQNRQTNKKKDLLSGLTQINLFFENSTRTRMSFELAGKRLGADVINMATSSSSIKKGETLIDTASTLNAMRPDLLVVRHGSSGAVKLLSRKVDCAVLNAGDGKHEHPTQALLDALTIRRRRGRLARLTVAICGDVLHSRVARSNIHLLNIMGARVRVIGPPTLIPTGVEKMGVEVFHNMTEGLKDCDIIMMLRLQTERMHGGYFPTVSEYFSLYGLDYEKLAVAHEDALIMHPGPMNRGVEIDAAVADDLTRSAIQEQVEMGVAVRMACLDLLTQAKRGDGK
ncbi:MAG: aspartate carbamoyltransferase catalytic subunit [Kordiimonadaceae bacterium]|jgi:aspartate carbamoyltransferase catalytic subunit|nr:aspartate carbamoyltransferase catalytic subunit [Kordiimonadaceae bacterium]MBT6035096.1 aspartate carbamoyltransferase catalytic subunit [Kordiimonadaceae bacterium]MBT6330566.1 aspartate carbamoyltransferase catalytic subunit [Kordiimonadaceae bacterium]